MTESLNSRMSKMEFDQKQNLSIDIITSKGCRMRKKHCIFLNSIWFIIAYAGALFSYSLKWASKVPHAEKSWSINMIFILSNYGFRIRFMNLGSWSRGKNNILFCPMKITTTSITWLLLWFLSRRVHCLHSEFSFLTSSDWSK